MFDPHKKDVRKTGRLHRLYERLSVVRICCGTVFFASSRSRGDGRNCNAVDDSLQRISHRKYSSKYLLKISFARCSGGRVSGMATVISVCPAPSDRRINNVFCTGRSTVYSPGGNSWSPTWKPNGIFAVIRPLCACTSIGPIASVNAIRSATASNRDLTFVIQPSL